MIVASPRRTASRHEQTVPGASFQRAPQSTNTISQFPNKRGSARLSRLIKASRIALDAYWSVK
ncbi:hypothetical protein L484_000711 [Morus notabilis]|uniref:Uncharacterized protein n=1 Tax=Morus notabilis TaxID=981085 RepID=W9SEW3_9ROSA|nr:hypothetical protein L484_000711 [Morus notabilis]